MAEREVLHRTTARVLPVNAAGEVLLLHGWDPAAPESPYWFSVGGAVEEGESLEEAGAREAFEETGVTISPAELRFLTSGPAEFDWGPYHLVQVQHWFAVRLDRAEPHFRGLEAAEVGTIDEARWWTPEALEAGEPVAPDTLTAMMRLAVAEVLG